MTSIRFNCLEKFSIWVDAKLYCVNLCSILTIEPCLLQSEEVLLPREATENLRCKVCAHADSAKRNIKWKRFCGWAHSGFRIQNEDWYVEAKSQPWPKFWSRVKVKKVSIYISTLFFCMSQTFPQSDHQGERAVYSVLGLQSDSRFHFQKEW